ncbi:MAG: cytochrome c oxidase subunit II [Planctomycetia bacterium]|nr:cytochrome c oxidase subunit II [Planctomycetia bacterium]
MHKFWAAVFGVIIVLCIALFVVAAFVPGWWLPKQVSTFGDAADRLFYMILWITTFFFVLTEALLVYNIWKFGDAKPGYKAPYVHGNHKLEVIWTIVPAGILVLISVLQIGTWEEIKYTKNFPRPDISVNQIVVVARQWEWRIRYPGPEEQKRWERDPKGPENWRKLAEFPFEDFGQYDDVHDVNAVHAWMMDERGAGRVLIHLKTRDVLHSFFLPHLRLKQDAVPGKVIPVWFAVNDWNTAYDEKSKTWVDGFNHNTGQFGDRNFIWDLACAEFCGSRHSMMKGRLYIHKDRADFNKWLDFQQKAQNARMPAAAE